MSASLNKLSSIAKAKAKLLKDLQDLEKKEREQRMQESVAAHRNIISLIGQYGDVFSLKQREDILSLLGGTLKPLPETRKWRYDVKPKYQLPDTGQTWSGRGRPPKAFVDWESSPAYKDWKDKNPNLKFPLYKAKTSDVS